MRIAYKVLAYLGRRGGCPGDGHLWFIAGLGKWVESGGVLGKAAARGHRFLRWSA